ncbi:MAG: hypothetical protein AAF728_01760 [Cyanobacteria bacterium P01_D01_bin.128]
MSVKQSQYEALLAYCCHYRGAIEILKGYRSYLELLPSMRRPAESIVPIPLPNIRVRQPIAPLNAGTAATSGKVVSLPSDLVLLMCDPEWKIKTGVEVFILIHRPHEDFSDLLNRWRQTQILLDRGYEWLMPLRYRHLLNEGADATYPLFVLFPETPDRILKGLKGAGLPVTLWAETGIESLEDAVETGQDLNPKVESDILDPDNLDPASKDPLSPSNLPELGADGSQD